MHAPPQTSNLDRENLKSECYSQENLKIFEKLALFLNKSVVAGASMDDQSVLAAGGKPSTWFPPGVTWRAEPIFLSSTGEGITLLMNESFY